MFVNGAPISQRVKLSSLISRPEVRLADLLFHVKPLGVSIEHDFPEVIEQLEIHYKYIGYIDREHQVAQKIQKYDSFSITDNIDYASIHSLSSEARQKLKHYRPKTIGHASRISGISPSDISVLLIHLGK
jgi:tRNA uridine 5-carboxymethylaminomethyl modification enzyme